jgi:hypothetical protein
MYHPNVLPLGDTRLGTFNLFCDSHLHTNVELNYCAREFLIPAINYPNVGLFSTSKQ